MSSANSDSFPPSFPNWMPFFLLNFWGWDFSTMLVKVVRVSILVLFPNLGEKALAFHL